MQQKHITSACNSFPVEGKAKVKGKAIPIQAQTGPVGSKRLKLPEFLDNWHVKVGRLSALCTGCLYPTGDTPWYSFLLEAELTSGPQCGYYT